MMTAAPQIVTLGAHVLDTIVQPVDEIPEGQGSLLVDEIVMSAAGPAGGTALVLAKLGARVVTSGSVGDDVTGRVLVGLLADQGIDVSNLRVGDLPTSASVLPIRSDGSRPALHVVGANALAADVVPWDALAAADHVHIGAPELLGPENVIEILEYARDHGATTSLDFLIGGEPAFYALIEPLLSHTDYVLPNAEQALGWTEAADLHAAAHALAAAGARVVAITDGGRDIVLVEGGELREIPIVPAEPVDTSGGGDAFSAGFVFAKLRGRSSVDAARFGSATAAQVVAGVGTSFGTYDAASIDALLATVPR
ncbi:MAG: sugar kinase, ribokinase family [Microbacterium sp.]|jgi:sugar/nucleoside kinase (ribokinase family)|nr:sugar kinase, ribokinase family [Microbacterium sp.]